jgi:hypothetical protein
MQGLMLVANRLYFHDLTEIAQTPHPLVAGLRDRDPADAAQCDASVLSAWSTLIVDGSGSRPTGGIELSA